LFGVVTSFRGTYKTDQWTLQLSLFNGTVDNGRILEGVVVKNLAAFQQAISSTLNSSKRRQKEMFGRLLFWGI
jgi:hypothetical protein